MNTKLIKTTDLQAANHKFRQGQYQEAIILYEKVLKVHPQIHNTIRFNLDLAKRKYNDPRKSQKQLDSGVLATQQDAEYSPPTLPAPTSSTVLDTRFYLEKYPDVKAAGVDPESHYFSSGEREGRWPNKDFDPYFYLRINADVRSNRLSPFRHYIESGFREGRLAKSPLEKTKRHTSQSTKPLLFVGHDGIMAGAEVVLLEVVRWFSEHTKRRIKLLLLGPGPLADRYANYAEIYVLPGRKIDDSEALKDFLCDSFQLIYINTVVSGRFLQIANKYQIAIDAPIIAHIHEMEKVLDIFPSELETLKARVTHWISASPLSTQTLIKRHRISHENITTVPAFIHPVVSQDAKSNEYKAEARKALGLAEDTFVVMGCGTVYWRKGPDLFIDVARKLSSLTERTIAFVWLGQGQDRAELESSLTQEERSFIIFAGNRTDANRLLAAADVFFLSSREDPFPLVVLESAQHGVPSICFGPATGITDFIEQDAGIVLSEVSAEQAATALNELLVDYLKRQAFGNAARSKLFERYTAQKQNLKILDVLFRHCNYCPSVSVIVPCYNHEAFIDERITSVLRQSVKDIELILLDDCSSDRTVDKIQFYLKENNYRIRLVQNTENSGSPFKQWEKGIAQAQADIVWIAEGDDSCDTNFLATLLPYFNDPMVNIASARIEIVDEKGEVKPLALQPYLDMAYPGKFQQSYLNDGYVEVNEQLGAICTLVNASALLIRKSSVDRNILKAAQDFKICGDWLIYLACLKNGKIAYDVNTRNLFRRHAASQVHKVEGTPTYFAERQAITEYVLDNYSITRRILRKAFSVLDHEWERFSYKISEHKFEHLYDKNKLRNKAQYVDAKVHVALYVHGMMFSRGGIERVASQLCNRLVEKGFSVTIYCKVHPNQHSIYPVYDSVRVCPIFDEKFLAASIAKLNRAITEEKVDIFIPMLSEWLFEPVIEATKHTGVVVIASEHNDPWKIEELWWSHEKRVACFEKADIIHLVLNNFSDSLPERLKHRVRVIAHGVQLDKPISVKFKDREKLIVSVGRLVPQKGFDRLIRAVSLIKEEILTKGYRIEIFGEGPLKNNLENLITDLELNQLIMLKGCVENIDDVYLRADFFCMPSEFEAFGVVIVEALSCGLPVIGFRNCNGLNSIIRDGVEGLLVDDEASFAHGITKFIGKVDIGLREKAIKRSEQFSLGKFYDKWQSLLDECIDY